MRSTFMGLEASKRGLFTQQSALYTTGHNISNANTVGYSRQRVNMETTQGYPGTGLNSPKTAGHIGTGVQASSVQRIRDEFIDRQYRQETNKLGYWESKTKAISQMEDIMSEPSEYGINEAFNLFWESLVGVSTSPESSSSRQVAVSRAEYLAESFNYMDIQLKQVQSNLGNELNVSTSQINSILRQIASINKQVQEVEPNGYMPNDLYDRRDTLVDQLNEYLPVTVSKVPSGGNALAIAEGGLTIKFNGQILVSGKEYASLSTISTDLSTVSTSEITVHRLDAQGNKIHVMEPNPDDPTKSVKAKDADGNYIYEVDTVDVYNFGGTSPLDKIKGDNLSQVFTAMTISRLGDPPDENQVLVDSVIKHDDFEQSKGKLLSLIDSYGYATFDVNGAVVKDATGNVIVKGYYSETLAKLDQLADTFVSVFNAVHSAGYTNDGTTKTGQAFFDTTNSGATGMKVRADIIANPNLLAASSGEDEEGNGKWAIELANLQTKHLGSSGFTIDLDVADPDDASVTLDGSVNLDNATFQSFYQSIIGKLGVDGQESQRLETTSATLQLTIANNRASMSSVSLDEEMTNMITFQQAYNANARMITVVDEMLDKIINGMGRAGL